MERCMIISSLKDFDETLSVNFIKSIFSIEKSWPVIHESY